MFFILHACACKIDDVEALVQSTCVLTRRVHDKARLHVSYVHTKPGLHVR